MKVLFDAHMIGQKKTGLERYSVNLIKNLSENKKINLVLYSNLSKNSLDKSFSKLPICSPLFENGLYRIFFGFNKAIKKNKPDIIHTSFFTPFIKTVPVVTTIHDVCFKIVPETFPRKTFFAFDIFFKKSLANSDAIICGSEIIKRDINRLYSIDKNKIFVTPYAPDSNFKFIYNKSSVRKILKYRFDIERNYFLVVGNIEKRKNPIPIINAYAKLLSKHEDIQLVFAGTNKMGELISNYFSNLIKNNSLKILSYVNEEELKLLYNGALSLIYNSVCEGFGLPILEAMACRTAVICSYNDVFREITGESAILYKNEDELFKAMEKILVEENFRKKYEALGYERSKYFSWSKTAKKTFEVYEWVLKNQKRNTI